MSGLSRAHSAPSANVRTGGRCLSHGQEGVRGQGGAGWVPRPLLPQEGVWELSFLWNQGEWELRKQPSIYLGNYAYWFTSAELILLHGY